MKSVAQMGLVVVMLLTGVGLTATSEPGPASALSVTATHPRLLANQEKFSELTLLTKSDDVAMAWLPQIRATADATLNLPATSYDVSSGTLLPASRAILERTYQLAFMWQLTRDPRYAERAWMELNAAAAFPDWNPQHFLDTAEMAHAFAIGYDWLYEYWSESRRATLRSAILTKAFQPATSAYDKGSFWVTDTGNWNVVCNSGLAMAALAITDTTSTIPADILARAQSSLRSGLTGYAPDGGYKEGITYWAYATSYLVTYISALKSASGSDQGLLLTPGLAKTATFAVSIRGPCGRAANFGDAWDTEKITTPLLGLQSLFNDDRFARRAIMGTNGPQPDEVTPRALIWYRPGPLSSSPIQLPTESRFTSADVATMRSGWTREATFTTLRGALGPLTGHSDLDAGQFSLDALGENWGTDLGADKYTLPGYFDNSTTRWQYYLKRPEGQNRMVFNPAAATDSVWSTSPTLAVVRSDPDTVRAVADLTSSSSGHVTSWRRGVGLFAGRSQVLVQDEVRASNGTDAWWFMHTRSDINVASDGRSAILSQNGKQLVARVLSPVGARFAYMEAKPLSFSPSPAGQSVNSGIKKLSIHLPAAKDFTLAVQFTPLRTGAALPPPVGLQPLSTWGTAPAPMSQLVGLSLDGSSLRDFAPTVRAYDVSASALSSAPKLVARVPVGATAQMTQATSVPGTASVTVTEPGKSPATYSVHFQRGAIPIVAVVASAQTAANSSAKTIDNLPYTTWRATGPQWLQYDLGRNVTLSHVEIEWDYMSPLGSQYDVLVSTDKITWTKAFTGVVKATKIPHWASFQTGPIQGRYIRVNSRGDGTPNAPTAIANFQAFSDNSPASANSPKTPHYSAAFDTGDSVMTLGSSLDVPYKVTRLDNQVRPGSEFPGTYISSAPGVAAVSATGTVTALRPGTTQISVSIPALNQELYATKTIEVRDDAKVTIWSDRDTYVQGGSLKDVNLSTAWQLYVRHNDPYPEFDRYAYMSFDFSHVDAANLQSAKLYFRANVTDTGGDRVDVNAHAVFDPWTESGTTFASRPAMGPTIGTATIDKDSQVREMDITAFVTAQAGRTASIGFTEDSPPGGLGLVVSISSRRSTEKPYIVIQKGAPG